MKNILEKNDIDSHNILNIILVPIWEWLLNTNLCHVEAKIVAKIVMS